MECGSTARDVAVGNWLALGDAELVASHAEGPASLHPPRSAPKPASRWPCLSIHSFAFVSLIAILVGIVQAVKGWIP